MSNSIRVNMLNSVNADSIQIERKVKNGENYTIIKNVVWGKDNSVLNGGLYAESEMSKSFAEMEGKLMPYSHPEVNGKYIAISKQTNPDAADALALTYIGAHGVNVRRKKPYYIKDIEINDRVASAHNGGKEVLDWANKAELYLSGKGEKPAPLNLSTGLNLTKVNSDGESNGKDYTWSAANLDWDHDAFVDTGAGGDEIGLAFNSKGEECEVITCNITNELDQSVTEDALLSKIWNKFLNKVKSTDDGQLSPEINSHIEVDPMKEMLINALKAKGVETDGLDDAALLLKYNESMKGDVKKDEEDKDKKKEDKAMNAESIQALVDTAVNAAVKPLQDQIAANANEKKSDAIKTIMARNSSFTEDELKEIPESMMNKLLAEAQPAAGLLGGRTQANSDESICNRPE